MSNVCVCRGRLAAATPMSEWLEEDYHLNIISAEKRSVLYIQVER